MTLTTKQSEFLKLAEQHLRRIGGIGRLTNVASPRPCDQKNTYEWAIMQGIVLMRNPSSDPYFNDENCKRLMDILNNHK